MNDCKPVKPKCATVCGVDIVVLPVPMGTSDQGQPYAPKTCAYKNTFVKYLADGKTYFYDKHGAYIIVGNTVDFPIDDELDPDSKNPVENGVITRALNDLTEALEEETEARTDADSNLQSQIDAITSASDVVDIVDTYADLEDYDTSSLTDKDIIKVLEDETHGDETTYYRWDATDQEWDFIGAMAAYYSKSETDELLAAQKDELEGEIEDLDTELTAAIEAEEAARAAADVLMQTAITNEATARADADATLTTNLAAETTAREAADTALNTAITDEATTRSTADTGLSNRIAAEVTARENGDSLLRTDLNAEITNRTNADTALQTAITNEATTRASETGALRSDLTAEATARSEADTTLQGNIDAEATARENADTALAGDISDEATARENADTALAGDISDEATARGNADTTLQNNIDAEATARGNADTTLQGNIDAEATARGNADTALGNRITALETDVNRSVMNDLVMETGASSVTFVEKKINLSTGTTSEERDVIPSASTTAAGTITAADYTSIQNSQDRLDALENGSVAVDNLPANPTQQELTDAWLLATDRQSLINRASIYDIDNTKVWTYYSNISEWEMVTAGTITINNFTNSAAGTILGSTLAGNVSANVDGTGSVSGWTALNNTVAGKQNTIDSTHQLSADLVDDTSTTHKFTTAADITKLSGIAAGAEVNVQSDWSVTDNTSDAYIKNKPNLAAVATSGDYDDLTNKPTLATVATSGSYNDLTDKPTYATVATTGSYNDLSDKPTIPTVNNATLTIQKNGTSVGTFTANASSNTTANITVPTKTSDLTNDSSFATTGDVTSAVDGLSATLATVATTGAYNDLTGKPTIPTVNNGTLTIQKNGTNVQTFTANQSGNAPANITVPTKTSDLTNDSGFITDRFYRSLVPFGTAISANKDLNTKEFLVVGKYYCSTNATVGTLLNCPTNNAFMMEVFSPLSTTVDNEETQTWVYRYRLLTELNGRMWVQQASSGATAGTFTYGAWRKFTWDTDLPTVNNGTLTIKKNGTNVQTFTANQSSNATANITVPTKTSDITNDSGFLTNTDLSNVAFVLGDATTDTGAAIGTSNIANGAVTAEKIADGAVDNIIMTTNDPGEGVALNQNEYIAVYEDTTQTGYVDSSDLTSGAVTTAKIADGAVTNAKLGVTWENVDGLFYKSGDVITETLSGTYVDGDGVMFSGFLTNSNTRIVISVNASKRLDNITTATVERFHGWVRDNNVYLANNIDIVSASTSIRTKVHPSTNSISICFEKTGGWGGTNNTAISAVADDFSITLS